MRKKLFFYGSAIVVGLMLGFFVAGCKAECDCDNCNTPECCSKCSVEQVETDSTKVQVDTLTLEPAEGEGL